MPSYARRCRVKPPRKTHDRGGVLPPPNNSSVTIPNRPVNRSSSTSIIGGSTNTSGSAGGQDGGLSELLDLMDCPDESTDPSPSVASLRQNVNNGSSLTTPPPPPPPPPPRLIVRSQLRQTTNLIAKQTIRENTKKAYNPKIEEFKEFLDYQFRTTSIENGRYTVTQEKVEIFMHYQSYRNKQPPTGKAKNVTDHFRPHDYVEVMDTYGDCSEDTVIDDPLQGIGSSAFAQYKAAIKSLWEEQRQDQRNSVSHWDGIWNQSLQNMFRMLTSRGRRVDRRNYKEKMNHETTHYGAVDQVQQIEDAFFAEGLSTNARKTFSSLRNRFIFLMTTQGILRGESLFKAELSDFFGVSVFREHLDAHPLYIVVCQIATGKTNKDLKLYGRIARHKDPRLCAVGAFAFYLFFRFSCTGEFDNGSGGFDNDKYDFTENNRWFDIKLLVDLQSGAHHGYTNAIRNQPYADAIKRHCRELNIPTNHFVHVGRVLGSYMSEVNEDPTEELRKLGNWDPTTQEKFYSTKLPTKILRSKAGFNRGDGIHINPRVAVMPPDELVSQVFPWLDAAADQVAAADAIDNKDRYTAHAFLRMMQQLRIVILQDAACFAEDSVRSKHAVLNLPVFKSEAFGTFRRQMHNVVSASENPLDASLEVVLPGVHERLNALQSGMNSMQSHGQMLNTMVAQLQQLQTSQSAGFYHQATGYRYMMQHCLQDIGRITQDFGRNLTEVAPAMSETAFTQHFGRPTGESTGDQTSPSQPEATGLSCQQLAGNGQQLTGIGVHFPSNIQGPVFPPSRVENIHVVIPATFRSVLQMKQFWYGEGDFIGLPIPGGIREMNSRFDSKWRTALAKSEKTRYSRISTVMETIAKCSGGSENEIESTIAQFEGWYTRHCKKKVSNLVRYLT